MADFGFALFPAQKDDFLAPAAVEIHKPRVQVLQVGAQLEEVLQLFLKLPGLVSERLPSAW